MDGWNGKRTGRTKTEELKLIELAGSGTHSLPLRFRSPEKTIFRFPFYLLCLSFLFPLSFSWPRTNLGFEETSKIRKIWK
ncbi:Hypothetical predicted protein [Prunus dulcis]|uniref:Uncharacterized protein n=1 Tax=Prunus dulcis TaxID=3755 RepID=A0A5E4EGJ1_PRUDU|nr:Hypothetical predicted protein [Prunus dulcis]